MFVCASINPDSREVDCETVDPALRLGLAALEAVERSRLRAQRVVSMLHFALYMSCTLLAIRPLASSALLLTRVQPR
jgi:hypothetical protein